MIDLFYGALTLAFLALTQALIALCERLMQDSR